MNPVLARRVQRWADAARQGVGLADAARGAGLPALFVGVLAGGQAGAELAPMFRFLGRHYDTRFSRTAALLQGAAVPAMVLTFGTMVGFVVVSMILPLVALMRSLTFTGGQP
jgi:type II secretory pathway component PulF